MSDWIHLEPHGHPHEQHSARGVSLFTSSFDIPVAIRSQWIEDTGVFVIEFRYTNSDEPLKEIALGDGSTVSLGKFSGRLFKLQNRISSISSKALLCLVDDLRKRAAATSRIRDNYSVAWRAVHQHRDDLLQPA